MRTWSVILVLATAITAFSGCDRTTSGSVPLSYDDAIARLRGLVAERPEGVLDWTQPSVTVVDSPPALCRLTMGRSWARTSKFEYSKMTDHATVILTPGGQTQTLVVVTVYSKNDFSYGEGERNRKAEKDLVKQLSLLFERSEKLEPSLGVDGGGPQASPGHR